MTVVRLRAQAPSIFTDDTEWIVEILKGRHGTQRAIPMSRGSTTGTVSTPKAAAAQKTESNLERDLLVLLDWDRRIERIASQPFQIDWRIGSGRLRRYTPDVIVKFRADALDADRSLKHVIYEVKLHSSLKERWASFKPKFQAAVRFARARQMRFQILTERQIRTPRLHNLKFLRRYRSDYLPVDEDVMVARRECLRDRLRQGGITTPAGLLEASSKSLSERLHLLPWIWQMVNEREIGIDLDADVMTMQSAIWLVSKK